MARSVRYTACALLAVSLVTVRESSHWLASAGRKDDALKKLTYYRHLTVHDMLVRHELAETEAVIREERRVLRRRSWKGQPAEILIAIVVFVEQTEFR